MSVEKVKDVSYVWCEDCPMLKIQFDPYWCPILIDTEYADRVNIWWDCDTRKREEAMAVYAVEECSTQPRGSDFVKKLKGWYEVDVPTAISYVKENLI